MKTTYCKVVAGVILFLTGNHFAFSQSGPEFINCPSAPISLCVNDPGVRLPANNQIYLGDLNLNASFCSVHVTQSIKVKSNCGKQLQYQVQLFLFDTSAQYVLKSMTSVMTDSLSEATLSFDTEFSPEISIKENGIPYTTGCMRYHRIKWILKDSCGMEASCEQLIDLYDCAHPQVRKVSGLTILNCNYIGLVDAHAKDFFLSVVDDCSYRGELSYSFSSLKFQPDTTFYICNVPVGVELPYTVWIADHGRDLNCDGRIEWREKNKDSVQVLIVFTNNVGVKCEPELPIISGKISTEDHQTVGMVSVNLESPGHVYPTFYTTQNGEFQFNHITVPANVIISAERDDNHKNGVSTLDLVRIKKHLLGIEPLDSPFDYIAADANNSQNVSTIDIVELRKLILGVYSKLPNNKSWRFFAKNSTVQDSTHPWPFKETIALNVTGDVSDADFIGIKIGDVNNTVQANAQALVTRESYQPIVFTIAPGKYEANEIVNIDFSINDLKSFNGFQFTLSDPDLEFLSASSNIIDLSGDDYALFDDRMTMSWFILEDLAIDQSQILFTIKARAKNSGNLEQSLQLNSEITDAELYSADETFIPKILIKTNDEDPLILMAPEPNPWSTACTITFHMHKEGNLIFNVYNMNGAIVFSEEKYYSGGYHEIQLNANDVTSDGLLFYTLQIGNENKSGKFVLLK